MWIENTIYLRPRFHFGNEDPKTFLVSPNNVELKRQFISFFDRTHFLIIIIRFHL